MLMPCIPLPVHVCILQDLHILGPETSEGQVQRDHPIPYMYDYSKPACSIHYFFFFSVCILVLFLSFFQLQDRTGMVALLRIRIKLVQLQYVAKKTLSLLFDAMDF